jgi:tryptophan synthase beta chain
MHTLGHGFVPAGIHAGGLRYHGMSPLISHLLELGLMEAQAIKQTAAFEAAVQFARTEGILPAPEPTHAIRLAVDEALAAKESGEEKTILFGLSGHGHFDLAAYDSYLSGSMQDLEYPEEAVAAAMADLPVVPVG